MQPCAILLGAFAEFDGGSFGAGHALSSAISAILDASIVNVTFSVTAFSFELPRTSSSEMARAHANKRSVAQGPWLSLPSGGSCAVSWA